MLTKYQKDIPSVLTKYQKDIIQKDNILYIQKTRKIYFLYTQNTRKVFFLWIFFATDTPKKYFILHWVYFASGCLGVFFMMMAHFHYTIDVIIAYVFTTHLFWIYHTLANNIALKV